MGWIFFQEQGDTLRGPFNEREMQKRYRSREISPIARVYFTNGLPPAATAKSYTLVELRTHCGIGCPFIDPESMPMIVHGPNTEEMQLKGINMGLAGIRAQCANVDTMEIEINSLTEYVERTCMYSDDEDEDDKKKKKRKAIAWNPDDEWGPTRYGLTRAEKLERLAKGINTLRSTFFTTLSLEDRVTAASEEWREESIRAARIAASKLSVTVSTPTVGEDESEVSSMVEAMNSDEVDEITLADFEKAPEKPKNCSRINWITHVKMAKKFANAVHHTFCVMKTGSTRTLDAILIQETLDSIRDWWEKWEKNPIKVQMGQLIDHELIMRLKEIDYFFCYFCKSVQFNLKQALAHFNNSNHILEVTEGDIPIDKGKDLGPLCVALLTAALRRVTTLPAEFQDADTASFSAPLLMSGMKGIGPLPDFRPSTDFLNRMKKKYEKRINGDIDENQLNDPMYASSVVEGIVRRHKSAVGREFFAEIDAYFKEGKNFHCSRCGWLLTSRQRYYKHLRNLMHVELNMKQPKLGPYNFCMITLSINIHTREMK